MYLELLSPGQQLATHTKRDARNYKYFTIEGDCGGTYSCHPAATNLTAKGAASEWDVGPAAVELGQEIIIG